MTLQESLLKNIRQDDASVQSEWVKQFNERYMHEPLVEGVDFTIDGGVLNYKKVKAAQTGYIWITEKPLVKFGTTPLTVSGEGILIRFNYDFKNVSDVIDEKNFDTNLHISSNNMISEIDMTKLSKVNDIIVYRCNNIKKVKLKKHTHSVDISSCNSLKEIGGCDVADWFEITNCDSLKTMNGFPKRISNCFTLNNLQFNDISGFPKKIGGNLYISNVYDREKNLFGEVINGEIKCDIGGAITK